MTDNAVAARQPPPANPDTVYLLGLMLASGTAQAITGAESGSVEALVPHWMLLSWTGLLLVGTAVTLTGTLWRTRTTGLLIEEAGRVMLGPAAAAYAVAVLNADAGSGALLAGMLLGLTLACGWRVVQIRRTIAGLRADMRALAARQEDR